MTLAGWLLLASPLPVALAADSPSDRQVVHILHRLAF
jgi:hypothetical protein